MLTPEEKLERKERWFGEEYNARRRERYNSDPEYREREKNRARVRNRKDGNEDQFLDPEKMLKLSAGYASRETVFTPDGKPQVMTVFSSEQLADLFKRTPHVIYRWRKQGKLPEAVLYMLSAQGQPKQVYSLEEVRVMIHVLGRHLSQTAYYHSSHVEVTAKLFEEVGKLRKKEGWMQ